MTDEATYQRITTLTAVRCALDALRWANPDRDEDEAPLQESVSLLTEMRIRLETSLNDEEEDRDDG